MNKEINLSGVNGKFIECNMSKLCWFNVGGKSKVFIPENEQDLVIFLKNNPDVKVCPLGLGSNLLVRDGGFDGVFIRTAKLNSINVDSDFIVCGAGAMDISIAKKALSHNLQGAEFLSGIPGSIGGGILMNAGCFGGSISDLFISATAFDFKGNKIIINKDDAGFEYRGSAISKDIIITSVKLQLSHGNYDDISKKMKYIASEKSLNQPTKVKTGGSTFKNPVGFNAWELIDKAGFRGKQLGGAEVSDKHTNFLINKGDASAADIECLGNNIKQEVYKQFGVKLDWEIQIIGNKG